MPPRRILSVEVAVIIITVGLLFVMMASALLLLKPNTSLSPLPFWPFQPTVIRNVDWDANNGQITVLVEYTGNGTVTLNEVYVNGTLDQGAMTAPQVLFAHQTTNIILSKAYFPEPTQIAIRITTSDGKDAYFVEQFFGIRLEQVDWNQSTGFINVLVRNTGHERVRLSGIFLNGTLDATAILAPIALDPRQTIEVILSSGRGKKWDTHVDIPINITTLEGASAEESNPIYRIWIQSVNWNRNNGEVGAYVYSNGYDPEVTIAGVYVNGTLDAGASIRPATTAPPVDIWSITLSKTYVNNPTQMTLKVVTVDGAFDELTKRPNAYPSP